jgi:hypothetical protein
LADQENALSNKAARRKPKEIRLSRIAWLQHQLAMPLLSRSAGLRRKVANIADISGYLDWQLATFGEIKLARTKRDLWKQMAERMAAAGEPWHGIEFGVAYGHATNWWLENNDARVVATWDGFDRFTGLPRAWREHEAGAFDAGNETPDIDDPRVAWHVGDVEDTIVRLDVDRISSGRRLAYFDLDVYEPSKVAWDWLRPHLRPGDILYFDEAFDADERRLLNETVLPAGTFDYIGATDMNLALEIRTLG